MERFRLTSGRRASKGVRMSRRLGRHWACYECVRGGLVVEFYGRVWSGLWAWAVVRGGVRRLLLAPEVSVNEVSDMKKKKLSGGPGSPSHLAAMESTILAAVYALVPHMAELRYEDGDSRRPGEVRLKPVGSSWMAEAIDYDIGARLQCSAPALDDALAGLALLLEQDSPPWEFVPWLKPQGAKPKKK